MQGHKEDLALDATLKIRVEPELKQALSRLAKRQRKTTAQMMREKLWKIVEEDERTAGQDELPLAISHAPGGGL